MAGMGMDAEFKCPPSAWEEFAGVDTTDLCLCVGSFPAVMMGQEHTVGPEMVRKGFDRLRERMAPYEREHGLPLADVYMLAPVGAMSFPDFKAHGCFSEMYKEAERLVDEGLVRSIGLNNATIHQIEATMEFARHRPVMATFESSSARPPPRPVCTLPVCLSRALGTFACH